MSRKREREKERKREREKERKREREKERKREREKEKNKFAVSQIFQSNYETERHEKT